MPAAAAGDRTVTAAEAARIAAEITRFVEDNLRADGNATLAWGGARVVPSEDRYRVTLPDMAVEGADGVFRIGTVTAELVPAGQDMFAVTARLPSRMPLLDAFGDTSQRSAPFFVRNVR